MRAIVETPKTGRRLLIADHDRSRECNGSGVPPEHAAAASLLSRRRGAALRIAAVDPPPAPVGAARVPAAVGYTGPPNVEGYKPKRQSFQRSSMGFLCIGIVEVQAVNGKLSLFAGIDGTSMFAVTS